MLASLAVLGTWYLVLGTRRGYRSRDQVGVWTRFRLSPAQYSVPSTRYIPIWSNRCSVTHCVDTDLIAVSSSRRTVGNYARLELGSGCERLMRMRRPFRLLVVGLAVLIGLAGCGGPGASADLLRTTAEGIDISMSASEEVLPLPGCRTQWLMNHDEEPPPGTCEKTVTVRLFEAHHGGTTVETSVVGEPNVDPLYAMGLASKNSAAGLSVFVVIPPSEAVAVRLMDAQGDVVDELASSDGLVALAGPGSDLTVEAVDADGSVIAACPPEGVLIDGVVFECTLAPDASVPSTTVPAGAP